MTPLHRLVIVATVVVSAACPSSSPSPGFTREDKLATDLGLLTAGEPSSESDVAARKKALGGGGAAAEVDRLLAEKMAARLAKDLVVTATTPLKDRHPLPASMALRKSEKDGVEVHHLRGACAAADAVPVKPWWDPSGGEILVCARDYKPEVKGDDQGRICGASVLDPRDSDVCGCGPMLIHCVQSRDALEKMKGQIIAEVNDTVGHVVNNDLPIETLFSMNETVGNFASEYLYRRARVVAGEPVESLFPIDESAFKPALRPRHEQVPGQHAGVLTTPFMMYASDALRGVMRNFYDYLWCSGVSRSNVETDAILALNKVDLRVGDGWKDLAAMNVCTDCHARLDYGMQFFWGWPSSTMGIDFRPTQARTGTGPLYGDHIKDERGEAELNPRGFAKLALEQPEFGACMTRKVVDHVFNGTDSADDVAAVSKAFQEQHRVKAMLKVALERYAARELAGGVPTPTTPTPTTTRAVNPDGTIALSDTLQGLLKTHCKECHGAKDPLPLVGPALDEPTLARVLDQVAFGAMPKTVERLPEPERRRFISETAALLFVDAAERAEAIRYHGDMLRAAPIHRYFSAMRHVAGRVGASDVPRPGATETAVGQGLLGYSPGVGLAQAVSAIAACKKHKGPERQACVDAATAVDVVVAGVP